MISEYRSDIAFDICLFHTCVCLVSLDLFSAVGFLRQMSTKSFRSKEISEVIHGLGDLGKIFLPIREARRLV